MTNKNLYEVTFQHTKFTGQSDSVLHVIAVDFDEALKKSIANTDQVKSQKDDAVELIGIKLVATIDVE